MSIHIKHTLYKSKIINDTYYPNGNIEYEYFDNKFEVVMIKQYRDSGELYLSTNVKNNKSQGRAFTYYKNRNIYSDYNYKLNKRNGLCKGYYSNGKLSIEVIFRMGIALSGAYYKKNGFKSIMTSEQLARKSDK